MRDNLISDVPATRLLLVDSDDDLRETMEMILEHGGFQVRSASNVNAALKLIASHSFEVLVSDLHMPYEGDGLTVVSAMRNSNPEAITIIFSAHPEMTRAAAAILAQTDEIFVKPDAIFNLVAMIRNRMTKGATPKRIISGVDTILEEGTQATIKDWLQRVDRNRQIVSIVMDDGKRSAHLPQLFHDLVVRLRNPLPLGTHALTSPGAVEHGRIRRDQGYTAAMMVEESRMLQVSIFQTLQDNLYRVNFSLLLIAVMAIADEVDSQLAQAMTGYVAEVKADGLAVVN
jgi:DNA-binding response OmpR family regulator